ncbi:MAG: chromosome segregation ATPase [Candidatus Azotimanducaceae bacterium]
MLLFIRFFHPLLIHPLLFIHFWDHTMRLIGLFLIVGLLAGCETAYYGINEKFGRMKPDILVDKVEDAMEAQEDAKEEFKSALEQFEAVVGIPESELKSTYNRLQDAFDDAESQASDVSSKIDSVEDVAGDLFSEWQDELEQISNTSLRRKSASQLKQSRSRSKALVKAMRRAESRMEPVLTSFRDHVLYLKHNLNAQAIASLKGELGGIDRDVGRLIRDMESSIAEAQTFIEQMEGG